MPQLKNRADTSGLYDNVTVENFSELSVELTALDIQKTASTDIWVKEDLTYTIVITNIDLPDPDDPLDTGLIVTNVTLEDTIEPTIARLVDGSVEIDSVPATEPDHYTYNVTTGLLTFTALTDLNPGESHTITFRVEKVI